MPYLLDTENFIDLLKSMVRQKRQEQFAESNQLSLGELILKLEQVSDRTKPLELDFKSTVPTGVSSWRGDYAELAITFEANHHPAPSVADFLATLTSAAGQRMEGYKGGEFRMSRGTPVWVANYGESSVCYYKDDERHEVQVIDIREEADRVVIVTEAQP